MWMYITFHIACINIENRKGENWQETSLMYCHWSTEWKWAGLRKGQHVHILDIRNIWEKLSHMALPYDTHDLGTLFPAIPLQKSNIPTYSPPSSLLGILSHTHLQYPEMTRPLLTVARHSPLQLLIHQTEKKKKNSSPKCQTIPLTCSDHAEEM